MAERIVDLLETVHIQRRECKMGVVPLRTIHALIEYQIEFASIAQARKMVMLSGEPQLLTGVSPTYQVTVELKARSERHEERNCGQYPERCDRSGSLTIYGLLAQ